MRVFYLIGLILYLSSQFTSCTVEDEFVDPLDMLNYDRATKSMKRSKTVSSESEPIQNDRCTAFLSRFVNILLKNTGLFNLNYKINEDDNEKLKSYVSVTINVQDLESLKNMANKKDIDYMEIDRILNGMFIPVKNSVPKFEETHSSLHTYYDQVKEVLYWISVGFISICLLYIIAFRIHHIFSVTFVIFVIFALAFASTWYTMYMKAEINRSVYLEHMPANCYEKTGNWFIFSWFDKRNKFDECKKYKEAIHLDPKYSIATTEVLAEMFSKIMLKPLETLGESIYIFNKSVLKDFPVWAQMLLVPIIIIIIIKTMLLSCALLIGRSLSMKSLFGYGGTSIGSGPTNNGSNYSTHPMIPTQSTVPQIPEIPKVNFNINLFHPSSSIDYGNRIKDSTIPFDNKLKINYNKQNNLISMLKNEVNDSVDSKEEITDRVAKIPRHRTMSF